MPVASAQPTLPYSPNIDALFLYLWIELVDLVESSKVESIPVRLDPCLPSNSREIT